MLTVRAPATSANLGPGYDCLSLALELDNLVSAEAWGEPLVEVLGEGAGELPADDTNIVYRAAMAVFETQGRLAPSLRLVCHNEIPTTRGLGSSSAARASGLLIGNQWLGNPLSTDELLAIGTRLEGHPDNIAACLLGGLQVCVIEGSDVRHCAIPVRGELCAVVFIPDFPMDTARARGLLPASVPLSAAVFNLSRSSLLVAALSSGRFDLLRTATQDAIHQPPRSAVFPAMSRFIAAAIEAGAHGAFLSGAGSSILALADPARKTIVEAALLSTATAEAIAGRVLHSRVDARGAEVTAGPLPAARS